ncbi:50S ribosomal protein L13 [Candidatus Margulisiibacteriota bacterium]
MKKLLKTQNAKLTEIQRKWYVIDVSNKVLGRLATRVAGILIGKSKPEFTSNLDCGDFVVVLNASKVRTTGRKMIQKKYFKHSGYPGGMRLISLEKMLDKKPEKVIELAVKGMLPQNRLGRQMLKKLKIYKGDAHPHKAQNPETLSI